MTEPAESPSPAAAMEYFKERHERDGRTIADLLAELVTVQAERDAIASLVSDRSEPGTYGKVDAALQEADAELTRLRAAQEIEAQQMRIHLDVRDAEIAKLRAAQQELEQKWKRRESIDNLAFDSMNHYAVDAEIRVEQLESALTDLTTRLRGWIEKWQKTVVELRAHAVEVQDDAPMFATELRDHANWIETHAVEELAPLLSAGSAPPQEPSR